HTVGDLTDNATIVASGNIVKIATGSITNNGALTSLNGNVTLTSGTGITQNSTVTANSGNISLTTTGSNGDNVYLNGSLTTGGSGFTTVTAGGTGNITQSANGNLISTG